MNENLEDTREHLIHFFQFLNKYIKHNSTYMYWTPVLNADVLGWPKSSFEFSHILLQKEQRNFLAHAIEAEVLRTKMIQSRTNDTWCPVLHLSLPPPELATRSISLNYFV